MPAAVVALNAGSSSVKCGVYAVTADRVEPNPFFRARAARLDHEPEIVIERPGEAAAPEPLPVEGGDVRRSALRALLDRIAERLEGADVVAVGHRIVHGGRTFGAPTLLDPETLAALEALSPLAPGHQPYNLAGVAAAQAEWPQARHVGCFDTAFHRTNDALEQLFALPRALADDGILRYGFHGLSYEHIAGAAPDVVGNAAHGKMIVAHLGSGASLCAMKAGRSVATTMGFTALDGLPMTTRCGALDPGVVLHLIAERGMSAEEVGDLLHHRSGLLGLTGMTGDMRALEASGDPRADEAIAYYCYRCAREIASLAAALEGVDCLVFTAGVGENSARVRAGVLNRLGWLGFRLDEAANAANGPRIGVGDGPEAWVMPTDEEGVLARDAFALLS